MEHLTERDLREIYFQLHARIDSLRESPEDWREVRELKEIQERVLGSMNAETLAKTLFIEQL